MNKVSLSGFPTATTIPYTTRQSEVCALKRIYRFLIGMYATSSNTFLYAGRIMRLRFEVQLFITMCTPAHDTRHGKQRSKYFLRQPDHFIYETGVKIHIARNRLAVVLHTAENFDGSLFQQFKESKLALSLSRGQGRGQVPLKVWHEGLKWYRRHVRYRISIPSCYIPPCSAYG